MKLRPYQREAIDATYDYFRTGQDSPLIVTPTGSGKSVILAMLIREVCDQWGDTQIIVLTHVKELVQQDANKVAQAWPLAPLGIYSAGLKRRQLCQVTVASIQSVYNKPHFHGRFELIIVDEAHLIPHSSEGMYRKFIDASRAANPNTQVIGLTATPYRTRTGLLHKGEGALFGGIAYEANVADLIADGYLCRLTATHGAHVDLAGIKTTGGDFNLGQLGERMSALDLVEEHADKIVQAFSDRLHWLGFCVTVEHAKVMSAAINRRGVAADFVHGAMGHAERDEKIRAFKAGETRCLFNMGILTTGFDFPAIDAIACLRPTQSPGLYVQIMGRGLRPVYAEGFDLDEREGRLAAIAASPKQNCLVLDFGGNVMRHGFIDKVEPPRRGVGGTREAPVKPCPKCGTYVPIMTKFCKGILADGAECGHEFQISERESESVAHAGAMLSTEVPPIEIDVDKVFYSKHVGRSGVPTLRVDYYLGLQRVSEYICVEHAGFARVKAGRWWSRRMPRPLPDTVDEALEHADYLAQPRKLLVSFAAKYPEIMQYTF